jgi:hypothetical protein
MELTLGINPEFINNPMTQVQPVYNQGTIEQYFKWMKSFIYILRGQTIKEKFHLTLQTLRGNDAALWQREWDVASPEIAEGARTFIAKYNNGTSSACFEGFSSRI